MDGITILQIKCLLSRLYNYIEVASHLPAGTDYSLFKKGIKPMWEDDRNKKGGRWLLNLNKSQRFADLDNLWLEVVRIFNNHWLVVISILGNLFLKVITVCKTGELTLTLFAGQFRLEKLAQFSVFFFQMFYDGMTKCNKCTSVLIVNYVSTVGRQVFFTISRMTAWGHSQSANLLKKGGE